MSYNVYEFDGWYTEAEGGDLVTSETADQTLYAHWTKIPDPLRACSESLQPPLNML